MQTHYSSSYSEVSFRNSRALTYTVNTMYGRVDWIVKCNTVYSGEDLYTIYEREHTVVKWNIVYSREDLFHSVRKVSDLFLFFRKPGGFQWNVLPWGDHEPSYAFMIFFPPANSVSWWQTEFEWGSVFVLSSDFHCNEEGQCSSTFFTLHSEFFSEKPDSCD